MTLSISTGINDDVTRYDDHQAVSQDDLLEDLAVCRFCAEEKRPFCCARPQQVQLLGKNIFTENTCCVTLNSLANSSKLICPKTNAPNRGSHPKPRTVLPNSMERRPNPGLCYLPVIHSFLM